MLSSKSIEGMSYSSSFSPEVWDAKQLGWYRSWKKVVFYIPVEQGKNQLKKISKRIKIYQMIRKQPMQREHILQNLYASTKGNSSNWKLWNY